MGAARSKTFYKNYHFTQKEVDDYHFILIYIF